MSEINQQDLTKLIETMHNKMNNRIDDLEMKVIFQDDLVNSLNDIIIRQDKEIMKLWDANRLLKQSMQDVKSGFKDDDMADVPPPHY